MLLAFSPANVLRATTAWNFSTSQLPKVVRTWSAFSFFTSKSASRQNGVRFFDIATSKSAPKLRCFVHYGMQFSISHLASWLRTRRFSEPTFRPSGASNHWKNVEKHRVSRLSYLFARLDLLSSDSFSFFFSSLLWLFPSLLFICLYCRKFDF